MLILRKVYRPSTCYSVRSLASKADKFDSISKMISSLDSAAVSDDKEGQKGRNMLHKRLRKPKSKVLTETSVGIQEAEEVDIMNLMNEYLMRNQVFQLRSSKGSTHDEIMTISSVKFNQDYSHAHAYWHSNVFTQLLEGIIISPKLRIQQQRQASTREYFTEDILENMKKIMTMNHKMVDTIHGNINKQLQKQEGRFRSHIIRTVNLRRVPRVYFACDSKTKELLGQVEALSISWQE